ncbi:MAG TPA: preprotein translocase subunit YajC [Azospira sp.]|nr:preprotein translocase subunit YajC [Azospira sp.]
MLISAAYAQTAGQAADPTGGLMQFLPMIAILVIMYFLMVRPQMKRAKEHKSLLEALQKGDEVVTQGGIVGRVAKVGENYLHIEIANGVEVVVQKPAVQVLLPKGTLKSL